MIISTVLQNSAIFLLTTVFVYLTYKNPDFFIQFSSITIAIGILFVAYYVARQVLIS